MTDEELEKKHRQNFTKKLNYYMQLKHKRQEDIVVDLGINKSTISTWCRGQKMPRTATIQKLATYFGVTVADCFAVLGSGSEPKAKLSTAARQLPPEHTDKEIMFL